MQVDIPAHPSSLDYGIKPGSDKLSGAIEPEDLKMKSQSTSMLKASMLEQAVVARSSD